MKTLSAMRNGWRCPKCGDQTTTDQAGRGFVRHLRNSSCNFEKGEKDDDWHSGNLEIKRRDTYRTRMQIAAVEIIKELRNNSDWSSQIRSNFQYILTGEFDGNEAPVELPEDLEVQRALVCEYLNLLLTIERIQSFEYYLRRFPFSGLPIERADHVLNVCEMYLSKCYLFKERLKKYLNLLKSHAPDVNVSGFINEYKRMFGRQLKARNLVHHKEYNDRTIELLQLYEKLDLDIEGQTYHYRETTRHWIREIQKTAHTLEVIVDLLAKLTFENVPLLSKYNKPVDEIQIKIGRISKSLPKNRNLKRERKTKRSAESTITDSAR